MFNFYESMLLLIGLSSKFRASQNALIDLPRFTDLLRRAAPAVGAVLRSQIFRNVGDRQAAQATPHKQRYEDINVIPSALFYIFTLLRLLRVGHD